MADKSRDPLHGVTLEEILAAMVKRHGWHGLGRSIAVRCFLYQPSMKSSLAFLRATPWARQKLEAWYISELPRRAAAPAAAVPCISSIARTALELLGVKEGLDPAASAPDARVTALAPAGVRKLLVYAPDAIGRRMVTLHPEFFAPLLAAGCKRLDLRSVFPAKTPVCFASMFSGLTPHGHGIKQYEKPVLKCPTIFDALPAAGLKAAIVAVKDSSIDLIFRGRPIEYYSEPDDAAVTARALELIADGAYDFLLVYHQEYDDLLHATSPWKDESLAAARRHTESFRQLSTAFGKRWLGIPRAAAFTPDHGAHTDPATGKGTHGDDIPADMDVAHFWKFGT